MSNWYEVAQGSQDERLRQVADYLNTPQLELGQVPNWDTTDWEEDE